MLRRKAWLRSPDPFAPLRHWSQGCLLESRLSQEPRSLRFLELTFEGGYPGLLEFYLGCEVLDRLVHEVFVLVETTSKRLQIFGIVTGLREKDLTGSL